MKHTTAENLTETIAATDPHEVTKPISELCAELDQFESAFSTLKNDFIGRGLPEQFLLLPTHIKSKLLESENEWKKSFSTTEEKKKIWDEKAPHGYRFRDKLVDDLEIGLWHIPEAMKRIDDIYKGEGDADMLTDIPFLVEVGYDYLEQLVESGTTEEQLIEAKTLGEEFSRAFADMKTAPDLAAQRKLHRDKTKTFAQEYLSLIRFYASRMYERNSDERNAFVSHYDREMKKRSRANNQ